MPPSYDTGLAINSNSYAGIWPITAQAGRKHFTQFPSFPRRKRLQQWYAVSDMLALALCAWSITVMTSSHFSVLPMAEFVLLAAAVFLSLRTGCMPFWMEVKKIVAVIAMAAVANGYLHFAFRQPLVDLWWIPGWIIAAITVIASRNMLRAWLRKKGYFHVPTLLAGGGKTAEHTRAALKSDPCLAYEITAQIKDVPKAFLQAGRSWETLMAMHGVEYVVVALDGHELAAATLPIAQLVREPVPFSISPPLGSLPVTGMAPQYVMNHDIMLMSHRHGLEQSLSCFCKRALDILISALALAVLSPIMLALALWIRSDGGPAIFAHTRLGRGKKSFPCLKFRSMAVGGDEILKRHLAENPVARQEWESTQKLVDDPRVTRAGKFLRKTSLDELPQLINVLLGQMSLVGPRPIVNKEVAKYDSDFAHYCRVRPGVTGLWQVSGRSDVSYPRRVHMDSWYVRNWSLWHDIAILCKTFPALLNRKGAY